MVVCAAGGHVGAASTNDGGGPLPQLTACSGALKPAWGGGDGRSWVGRGWNGAGGVEPVAMAQARPYPLFQKICSQTKASKIGGICPKRFIGSCRTYADHQIT